MTIQVHLLVHIVDEVAIAGTVHSRWMFFLERFMKTLKGFVRQRARPEGSMAEGWLVQESMVYVTEFLAPIDPDMPLLWAFNKEDERMVSQVPQGKGIVRKMNVSLREKVMRFCFINLEMQKWIDRYEEAKRERVVDRATFRTNNRARPYPDDLALLPTSMDILWLQQTLREAVTRGEEVSDREKEIARGCDFHYKKYSALWCQGKHFRVENIDSKRTTFDCGVMANFVQENRASTSDANPETAQIDYCGTIQDILELDFRTFSIFILDVKWFRVVYNGPHATVRRDESGFFAIDSTKLWTNESDTFVLPEQCEQVAFHPDRSDPRWWYVVQVAARGKQIFQDKDVDMEMPLVDPVDASNIVEDNEDIAAASSSASSSSESTSSSSSSPIEPLDPIDSIDANIDVGEDDRGIDIEIDLFGMMDLVEDAQM